LAFPLLFIGITVGLIKTQIYIIPLIFGFSATFFYFQLWLVELNSFRIFSKIEYPIGEILKTEKKISTNVILLRKIFRCIINDFIQEFLLVLLVAAIFNQLILFIVLYGLYFPLRWVLLVYYTMKKIEPS